MAGPCASTGLLSKIALPESGRRTSMRVSVGTKTGANVADTLAVSLPAILFRKPPPLPSISAKVSVKVTSSKVALSALASAVCAWLSPAASMVLVIPLASFARPLACPARPPSRPNEPPKRPSLPVIAATCVTCPPVAMAPAMSLPLGSLPLPPIGSLISMSRGVYI